LNRDLKISRLVIYTRKTILLKNLKF